MAYRVLHVLPHQGGGGESYIDLLESMPDFVHERFFLSSGRTPMRGLLSIPIRWPQMARQSRRVDLLHTHGDVTSAISLPLFLRSQPAVMTGQGLHMLRRAQGGRRVLIARAMRAVAANARTVICSSASERDELSEIIRPADRSKLHVILNGVDLTNQPAGMDRDTIRARLDLEPDVVVGLFVGQLEARKAPLLAARAANAVRDQDIPFVLVFAGDGPQSVELQQLAGPAVRPLGFRSDVAELMKAADVFVQSSEREGMSFALLEAMASGMAIVAADGPGNPEAVGDAGLLFAAGDAKALTSALLRLSQDHQFRKSLAARALARASSQFGAERFVSETRAVYLASLKSEDNPGPQPAR